MREPSLKLVTCVAVRYTPATLIESTLSTFVDPQERPAVQCWCDRVIALRWVTVVAKKMARLSATNAVEPKCLEGFILPVSYRACKRKIVNYVAFPNVFKGMHNV